MPHRILKLTAVTLVLLGAGGLASCTSSDAPARPESVVENFVRSYDEWAQSGFSGTIPDTLRDLTTDEMFGALESDQRWHRTGDVKQHGGVKILSIDVTDADDESASVVVTLDASAVTVTAEDQETWVDYSAPIVTTFKLIRNESWLVSSSSS